MSAAYQVDVRATADESYSVSFEWKLKDGSAFPWPEYTVEYSIVGPCGRQNVPDETVAVDANQNTITFELPIYARLKPGEYQHACRVTHTETGRQIVPFTGNIIITEGPF